MSDLLAHDQMPPTSSSTIEIINPIRKVIAANIKILIAPPLSKLEY